MNVQEEHNKRVTFNMTDSLVQKLDELMVMMGKLVTKDKEQNRQFKLLVSQPNRGREQRGFQDRFRSDNTRNNTYREDEGMDKIIKVGQDIILIIEVIMEII